MLQLITVTLDLEKITEFGSIILKVIPPREDLPNGTVLIHDPISLPGFKVQNIGDTPAIAVTSSAINATWSEPKPKTIPESGSVEVVTPSTPPSSPAPLGTNVIQGAFGKKGKGGAK